jgi:hypothetical protein
MPSKAPYIASAIPLGVATLVYLNTRESDFQKRVEACGNDPYAKGNDDYYQTTKTVDTFMWCVGLGASRSSHAGFPVLVLQLRFPVFPLASGSIITPFFKGASSMIGGEFVLYALTTVSSEILFRKQF